MKVCPNCQTPYNDDSLKFCLQCGTPLSEPQNAPQTGGNGIIIAAILGGFLLLALVVGGLGVYLFSRANDNQSTVVTNSANSLRNSNERVSAASDQKPLVEQLNSNKQKASVPANTANSGSSSNKTVSPRIVASSSSVRKPETGNFYFPNFAFDNNPATAWCEGARGAGQGEWLQFDFDREIMLKEIKIQPGYFKNDEVWRKNNRLARISVKFSDDSTREFSFDDERKTQTLDVGETRTKRIKITIEDYFAGSSDSDDTLISEVSFVTEP